MFFLRWRVRRYNSRWAKWSCARSCILERRALSHPNLADHESRDRDETTVVPSLALLSQTGGDQLVGMVDPFAQFVRRNPPAQLDRVPMLLVHVITGAHLLVAIAQIERALWVALQAHMSRDTIERGDGENFPAHLKDKRVRAERR